MPKQTKPVRKSPDPPAPMKWTDPIAKELLRQAMKAFILSTAHQISETRADPEKIKALGESLRNFAKELSDLQGEGEVEWLLSALSLKTNLGVGEGSKDSVAQESRLNVEQAAEALGCSVRTMYLWMKGRGLPYHRGFKKGNYFLLSELSEWVARQEVEAG